MLKKNQQNAVSDLSSSELSDIVVKGMQEKKAQNILIMDLRHIKTAVADFFVICSGTSDTQIDAIADSVEAEVYKTTQQMPWHKEGKQNREWILIDYVDVVAHVFKQSKREQFALEDLWGDAQMNYIPSE